MPPEVHLFIPEKKVWLLLRQITPGHQVGWETGDKEKAVHEVKAGGDESTVFVRSSSESKETVVERRLRAGDRHYLNLRGSVFPTIRTIRVVQTP